MAAFLGDPSAPLSLVVRRWEFTPMKITLLMILLLLTSMASFVFGARFGVYQDYLMNSSVEATLVTGELEALRGGKLDLLIR